MNRDAAYRAYETQPRPRSLKRLSRELGVSYHTLRYWSKTERWGDKLAAHDERRSLSVPGADLDPDATHLVTAREMQAAGREMVAAGQAEGGLLIERGVKLERAALASAPDTPTDREQLTASTLVAYGEQFRQHILPLAERFRETAETIGPDGPAANAWRQAAGYLDVAYWDFADALNALHAEAS